MKDNNVRNDIPDEEKRAAEETMKLLDKLPLEAQLRVQTFIAGMIVGLARHEENSKTA